MTFLNPFVLFGLIAAAVPVLLHLFNLRKLKTIEFSTLSFLKELQRTKIRRIKIRQLLLLFLRTLLVILMVTAFSRPTLRGALPGGLGEQAKTTAVVIVDDSYSMTGSDERGEFLKQAKDAALDAVNALKDGDEVFIVRLSEISPRSMGEPPSAFRNFASARVPINEIRPSYLHRTIEHALRYSSKLLAESKNFNKEVYVISDFQAGTVETRENPSPQSERLFPPETRFFFIPVGKRVLNNVGITSVTIPNAIFEPGKPFVVRARLGNHSQRKLPNHVASVFLNGTRVSQKGVDLEAGKSVDTEFSLVPRQTGFVDGIVEIEDDDLEFDNRSYFTVYIPEELRVLLVGTANDLHYIRAALATRQVDTSTGLKLRELLPDRLTSAELNNIDVLVLSNVELNARQSEHIRSFVDAGGGFVYFPGLQTTANSFNTSLANTLKLPTLDSVERQRTQQSGGESFLEFERVDFVHPVFQGMFDGDEGKTSPYGLGRTVTKTMTVESPRIQTSVRFSPTPKSTSIIALSNGSPFWLEHPIGSGRVILSAVAANLEWSDFPLKGIFVPLLHRTVSYVAQEQRNSQSTRVGDETVLRIHRLSVNKLSIQDPAKTEVTVHASQLGNEKVIHFRETKLPGLYTLKSGDEVLEKFVVNMDPDESDTAPVTEAGKERMLQRLGIPTSNVATISEARGVRRAAMESRYGAELWRYFLIASLIVALAEMFVASDTKRSLASITTMTVKE